MALVCLALGPSGCGGEDEPPAPDAEVIPSVPRSARGSEEAPAERAEAVRIIERDPLAAPLIEDAGGYSLDLRRTGPINGPGRHRFIGVVTTLRFDEPLTGTYALPSHCIGLEDERFGLPPTPYELEGVRAAYVETAFGPRRVIQIDPIGDYSLPVGIPFPKLPPSCEQRARLDAGE